MYVSIYIKFITQTDTYYKNTGIIPITMIPVLSVSLDIKDVISLLKDLEPAPFFSSEDGRDLMAVIQGYPDLAIWLKTLATKMLYSSSSCRMATLSQSIS